MTKTSTHTWIKRIEPILQEEVGFGKQGWIPPFDFATFSEALSKALGIKLSLTSGTVEWKQADHLLLGFGTSPCVYAWESPAVRGTLFWVMAERDVHKIASCLEPQGYLSDPLAKGVYEYALLEVLDSLQALPLFKPFSGHLSHTPLPDHERFYCVDVSLQYGEETLWGRLVMSKETRGSIEKHFATSDFPIDSFPLLPLSLHLSAGFVQLTEEEYSGLHEGDLVILDEVFFRPKTQKGSLQLKLHDKSLFQVKIKDDQIKILDFSYDVEEALMDEDEDEEMFEDEAEEPLLDEELKQEELQPQKIKLQDVPLTLHVEVKRLRMTLAELHALAPGQSIPLVSGGLMNLVHLTLNGQAVAEGELMEISDNVIGVKLNKIYK